jgi:putative Mg2+ transporter-C (MgtC) family protein
MLFISLEESIIITRILIALVLGFFIGLQREHRKIIENNVGMAGLRTHTIVTIGAALVSAIGAVAYASDNLRLAASILTGIGFIGAGTIIANNNKIKGLVNAATIWVAATIGIAVGLGFTFSSILATCLMILILELRRFERID